jgi:cephalosporin hydroxylase
MNFYEALIYWKRFMSQSSEEQVKALYNYVLTSPPGDVIEVGSATGGTTIVLIGAAENVGKHVYSVDPYPQEYENVAACYTSGIMKNYKESFSNNILNGRWKNIIQYNKNLPDCIDLIPEKLSVAFIDGCHEYSFVLNEFNLLYPRIVEGGYMCIHDIGWGPGQLTLKENEGPAAIKDQFIKTFPNYEFIGSMLVGKKG